MPKYFFKTTDGGMITEDDAGTDLATDDVARQEAIRALADMAKDELPYNGNQRDMSIQVFDDRGSPLFRVGLEFYVEDSKPK